MNNHKVIKQVIRYVAGTLIIIVGMIEILQVIGIPHSIGYDILKALAFFGLGIYVAFYDPAARTGFKHEN